MAHHRQEFRSRPGCGFSGVTRVGQHPSGVLLFGDVGEGADREAGVQHLGADFQRGAVPPGAAVDAGTRFNTPRSHQFADWGSFRAGELPAGDLPFQQRVKCNARLRQVRGQAKQFGRAGVQHGNTALGVNHKQALADIVHRRPQHFARQHQVAAVPGERGTDGQDQDGGPQTGEQAGDAVVAKIGQRIVARQADRDGQIVRIDAPPTDDAVGRVQRAGPANRALSRRRHATRHNRRGHIVRQFRHRVGGSRTDHAVQAQQQ